MPKPKVSIETITFLFRFVRLPNLIIVALTQYLLYQYAIIPYLQKYDILPALSQTQLIWFIISTVIITAGGYIINDIYDYPIDKINKPDKCYINTHISIQQARLLYISLNLIGFVSSFILAYQVYSIWLSFLYPLAALILWWYAYTLKKTTLVGNFVVAVFCALVPALVYLAEQETCIDLQAINPLAFQQLINILIAYACFAFLATMYREIVKDIEDIVGDKAHQCRTLPIVYGTTIAKVVANIFAIVLLFLLVIFLYQAIEARLYWNVLYLLFTIIMPLLLSLFYLLYHANTTSIKKTSLYIKIVMLMGLIYLPIYHYTNLIF